MGKIVVDLSVSLDGFVAGPDDGVELPLGRGGEALFAWMNAGPEENRVHRYLQPPEASKPVVDEWTSDFGAIVTGRRTFDIANGWRDGHPIDVPIFVLTHEVPTSGEWSERVVFVTEGLGRALELARDAAGGKHVSVCAGNVVSQLLQTGQLDEIRLSLVPVLLGGGVRFLDQIGGAPVQLEQLRVIASDGVTHLSYAVRRDR